MIVCEEDGDVLRFADSQQSAENSGAFLNNLVLVNGEFFLGENDM
jgi:hypothetical protein